MEERITSQRDRAAKEGQVDPHENDLIGKRVWVVLGALVGAVTVGATGYLLFEQFGGIIGIVVGAIVGGLEGKSLVGLIRCHRSKHIGRDTYTTRLHHESFSQLNESQIGEDSDSKMERASREAWLHLEETSKDLLTQRDPME